MMEAKASEAQQEIALVVTTTRGTASFTFSKTTKVEEVIQQVRDHFELTGAGSFTLVRESNNEALAPTDRPLVSFGLEDEERLTLTGGGTNV